jgi:hypothetical protein
MKVAGYKHARINQQLYSTEPSLQCQDTQKNTTLLNTSHGSQSMPLLLPLLPLSVSSNIRIELCSMAKVQGMPAEVGQVAQLADECAEIEGEE